MLIGRSTACLTLNSYWFCRIVILYHFAMKMKKQKMLQSFYIIANVDMFCGCNKNAYSMTYLDEDKSL